jgi:predicted nucleic acid-binding protein
VIVVSDSSPLVTLARVSRLSLLAAIYQRILTPVEVHHEVTVTGRGLPGAEEVRHAGWIELAPQESPTTGDPIRHQTTSG